MSWTVVSRDPGGPKWEILCDTAEQVVENYRDQKGRGREVTIEEPDGTEISPRVFGIS